MVAGSWLHINEHPGNAMFAPIDPEVDFPFMWLGGAGEIEEEIAGVALRIGPGDFFQANPGTADAEGAVLPPIRSPPPPAARFSHSFKKSPDSRSLSTCSCSTSCQALIVAATSSPFTLISTACFTCRRSFSNCVPALATDSAPTTRVAIHGGCSSFARAL